MTPIVRLVGDKATISGEDKIAIPVPQLSRNHSGRKAIPQRLNSVSMSPVVKRGLGQSQGFGCSLVDSKCGVFSSGEQRGAWAKGFGVVSEDRPRPRLCWPHEPVAPSGLTSACMNGRIFQVHVASGEPFYCLPLNPRRGHQSLDRTVRHGERGYQCPGLSTVKPNHSGSVGFVAPDVSYGIVGDDLSLYQPAGKDRKRSAVSVAGRARDLEARQELADRPSAEVAGRESLPFGDHAPDLFLVLGVSVPFAEEAGQVSARELRNELIQPVALVGVEDFRELGLPLNDEFQGPVIPLPQKCLDHPLHGQRGIEVGRATSENPAPAIGQGDAGFIKVSALRFERHLNGESNPTSDPIARGHMKQDSVSLYPGRDSNSYATHVAGDFETTESPFVRNNLARLHRTASPRTDAEGCPKQRDEVTPRATPTILPDSL